MMLRDGIRTHEARVIGFTSANPSLLLVSPIVLALSGTLWHAAAQWINHISATKAIA